jgi:hypothetical protein
MTADDGLPGEKAARISWCRPALVPGLEAPVAACPYCGLPSQAITQDDRTGEPYAMCENGHSWQDDGPDNAG